MNWEDQQIIVLLQTKIDEFLARLDLINLHDQFETNYNIKVEEDYTCSQFKCQDLMWNGMACKNKLGVMYDNFKWLFDYMNGTKHKIEYWDLTL